jgi:hypothetical protein
LGVTASPAPAGRLPVIDYSSHPAYGGMFAPDEALRERAMTLLQPLLDEMQEVEAWKAGVFGYRYGHDGALGEELARTGLVRFDLPGPMMDPISRAAAPVLTAVKDRVGAMRAAGEVALFKDRMEAIDPAVRPELWSGVDAMLTETGIYDLTQRFFGGSKGAKLKSVAVLLSTPDDRPDPMLRSEEQTPPTAGLHIDSAGRCILKAVLYLNDVGPDQGPFGMVPESHRWEEGSVGRVCRRAFDRSKLVARGMKERRMFISLPPELQVKAEFGGDLLPGSPECDQMVAQESVSLGARGLLSLFDPEAIHRGGQARAGERHAILITIRSRW